MDFSFKLIIIYMICAVSLNLVLSVKKIRDFLFKGRWIYTTFFCALINGAICGILYHSNILSQQEVMYISMLIIVTTGIWINKVKKESMAAL